MKKRKPLAVVLPLIRVVRMQRVIFDSDLASLYGVTTKRLNQQFHRNRRRFPDDFAFVLTQKEAALMRSQIVTASRKRNISRPPRVYTEHGAVMAANVLNSERAVVMSVEVVRAFVQLRRIASSHEKIARILADLETAVSKRLDRHDQEIASLFAMLESLFDREQSESREIRRVGSA